MPTTRIRFTRHGQVLYHISRANNCDSAGAHIEMSIEEFVNLKLCGRLSMTECHCLFCGRKRRLRGFEFCSECVLGAIDTR